MSIMQIQITEQILRVSQNKMAKTVLHTYHILQRPSNSNQITGPICFRLGTTAIIEKNDVTDIQYFLQFH